MEFSLTNPLESTAWQSAPGPPIVSAKTYANRLRDIKRVANELNMDVLLVGQPENVLWLTGFEMAGTFYFTEVIVDVRGERDPVIFAHKADADLARTYAWPDEVRAWQHGNDYITDFMSLMNDMQLARPGLRVGSDLEGWSRLRDVARLEGALDTEIVDVTLPLERLRVVLDPEEQPWLLRSAAAGALGMHSALLQVRVGAREFDIAAAFAKAYYAAGGENPSLWPRISSGVRATRRHALASARQVLPGEVVTVEAWSAHRRYGTVIARTSVASRPSKALLGNWSRVCEALEAGRAALVPGATGGSVWQAMHAVLAGREGWVPQRLGLGVGLSFPLSVKWSLLIQEGNEVELEPGMPVALLPGIYADGQSTCLLGETFIVTPEGGSRVTLYDCELVTR